MEGDLQLHGEIGSGAVSKVYKGIYKGEDCAVKVLCALTKNLKQSLVKEYSLLKNLNHKNVVRVKAFIEEKDSLVLELCGITESVIDVKDWSKSVEKDQLLDFRVIQQVQCGLSYLHDRNVIHCDLKSSNCLVTGRIDTPVVKVADFGIAYFQTLTHTETQMSQECSGSIDPT